MQNENYLSAFATTGTALDNNHLMFTYCAQYLLFRIEYGHIRVAQIQ